jgi:CDP-glucose 4,6-dehydratase
MAFADAYRNKRVFLTGHTGFKGSWLAEWLLALGANVTGFSLPPPTQPALFNQLALEGRLEHLTGDVLDLRQLCAAFEATRPDFVFHLAAQPLVLRSYREPVETFSTNIIGTVNLLEAARRADYRCSIVAVTTDKCYENAGGSHHFSESDPMGGHDPYSASKGAAELVISAYRRSYFSGPDSQIRLASARAGNVVGGGDWAPDRIVPDCIRALERKQSIPVRNKDAIRPWQHVLEPLSGYLSLGAQLASGPVVSGPTAVASAFNFGPDVASNRTVGELVREILRHWPGEWDDKSDPHAVHEAKLLSLSTDKALQVLQWSPVWSFDEAIRHTITWYREHNSNPDRMAAFTLAQIGTYTADARKRRLHWST